MLAARTWNLEVLATLTLKAPRTTSIFNTWLPKGDLDSKINQDRHKKNISKINFKKPCVVRVFVLWTEFLEILVAQALVRERLSHVNASSAYRGEVRMKMLKGICARLQDEGLQRFG